MPLFSQSHFMNILKPNRKAESFFSIFMEEKSAETWNIFAFYAIFSINPVIFYISVVTRKKYVIIKVVAGILAAVSMATCVAGMSASAIGGNVSKTFTVEPYNVTAAVYTSTASIGGSTSSSNTSVINRYVKVYGTDRNGSTVSDYDYSKNGTASIIIYPVTSFTGGNSYHSADTTGNSSNSARIHF